jgi:predicted transcriptional regulator
MQDDGVAALRSNIHGGPYRALSYTCGMKTAVSIPDPIFRATERLARRMKKSRSRLYSEALAEYVSRHSPDEVTETMNAALKEIGDAIDPFAAAAGRRVLERVEW